MLKVLSIAVISLIISPFVSAGTVVQVQGSDALTTMMTDGSRARINMSDDEYVIINFSSNEIYFINPAERRVLTFDAHNVARSASGITSKTPLTLRHIGSGGRVAGFQTDRYEYLVNNRSCGVVYASWEAVKLNGVKFLLHGMQAIIDKQLAALGGFAMMMDECQLADMILTSKSESIGAPMRTEENGQIVTQVTSIKVGVDLSADVFAIPANYKNVNSVEKMRQKTRQGSVIIPVHEAPEDPVQHAYR